MVNDDDNESQMVIITHTIIFAWERWTVHYTGGDDWM